MSENLASSQTAVALPKPAGRIAQRFRALSEAGEMGLVAYITAGDPSLAATEKIVLAAANAGADVIELGVPFSDTGADGVLATDLTPEEAGEYRATLQGRGLDTIFLAAPTSTDARLAQIGAASSGFLYVISRAGVTGQRAELPAGLPALIRRARKFTTLPIAVGFGISLPTHVTVLGGMADAAVVGSALMAEIEKAGSPDAAATAVAERIRLLKSAARTGVSRRSTEAS